MLHAITTEAECRLALAAAFPALTVTALSYLAEGWDSTVFAVNGTHVFRFPKRAGVDATIQKEIQLLPVLVPAMPTAIPDFDFVSGPTSAFAWHIVGYRKIAGRPIDGSHSAIDDARLAPALAATLRALHAVPAERAAGLGVPVFTPMAWLARYAALFERAQVIARPLVTEAVWSCFIGDWSTLLADPRRAEFTPALIHGDLALEHILTDASGALAGIIDFGDAMIGDPALDVAGLPLLLAERVLVAYSEDPSLRASLLHRRGMYRRAAPLHALAAGEDLRRQDLIREGVDGLVRLYA